MKMGMKIAVIGSGLAAVSAIKALVSRGIRPMVLDYGDTLDAERRQIVSRLSSLAPQQWTTADRETICSNPSIHTKNALPIKLAFGSDYFYGRSHPHAPLVRDQNGPPLSYAYGGLSVGWAGTALPADHCDIEDWPIGNSHLQPYYAQALKGLPYSASVDDLSLNFPLHKACGGAIRLSAGNRLLLQKMQSKGLAAKDSVVFGQSRLMLQLADTKNSTACKYCGHCMSGCVYGSIYKASQDLDRLRANDLIDYVGGVLVQRLAETEGLVKVSLSSGGANEAVLLFDRVFLAAGAVGSTRIVLQSKQIYQQPVGLKSTGGFVMPLFSLKRMPTAWPQENTLPGIFLEFKVNGLSNHWVHTQMSTPNEWILARLGITREQRRGLQAIKRHLSGHLMVAHCNLHSDHANGYEIHLEKGGPSEPDTLVANSLALDSTRQAAKKAAHTLSSLGLKFGCHAMLPWLQNTPSFHVGGSLPMRANPVQETDTDCYGCPKGWKRIHVVDSSIFPSLPGTTVGLLAMANAARIASEVELA